MRSEDNVCGEVEWEIRCMEFEWRWLRGISGGAGAGKC